MRPAARVVSGAVLLVMVGVVAALVWGLPAYLRVRGTALLASQLNLDVEVAGAGLTRDGVRLEGVSVAGGTGHPQVDVEEMRAQVSISALLGRSESPLRRLHARGVQIFLVPVPEAEAPAPPVPMEETPVEETQALTTGSSPSAAPSAAAPPRLASLLNRAVHLLASGAGIHLEDVEIRLERAASGPPLMGGLEVELQRLGPGRFHLRAASAAGVEPELAADLELEPDAQRLVGRLDFRALPVRLAAVLAPGLPLDSGSDGRLSGRLDLTDGGEGATVVTGRFALAGATVRSAALASRPVRDVGVELAGAGVLRPAARRLEVTRAEALLKDVRLQVSGALEWTREHYLIDLLLSLPPTPCNAAAGAIPQDLLGELAGFAWEGDLEGSLLVHLDSRALREGGLEISLAQDCRFVNVPEAVALGKGREGIRQRVRTADGAWHERPVGPGTEGWTPLPEISPHLVQAVLAHEDAGFFRHGGFSAADIRAALVQNLEAGRYRYGASTISMQLARSLYLDREKTLARKIQEVLLTWYLETVLDKQQILELYLNVVDYGPDLVGVRQGARHYFARAPSNLTPAQAAFLACILPAPHRYHRSVQAGEMPPGLAAEMENLLRRMARRGDLSGHALQAGLREAADLKFSGGGSGGQLR